MLFIATYWLSTKTNGTSKLYSCLVILLEGRCQHQKTELWSVWVLYSWKLWHRNHSCLHQYFISQKGETGFSLIGRYKSVMTIIQVISAASTSSSRMVRACRKLKLLRISLEKVLLTVQTSQMSSNSEQCPSSHSDTFPFWFEPLPMRISRQLFT